jgi:hypothetical protein
LRKFRIICSQEEDYEPRDYPLEAASFYTTLQHNYKLEELELGSWEFKLSNAPAVAPAWKMTRKMFPSDNQNEKFRFHLANIHFLLSLNRSGRGKVMGPSAKKPTNHDWINAMADQEDLSAVYYFLRANPALCKIAPKATTVRKTANKKGHGKCKNEDWL